MSVESLVEDGIDEFRTAARGENRTLEAAVARGKADLYARQFTSSAAEAESGSCFVAIMDDVRKDGRTADEWVIAYPRRHRT